MLCRPDDEKNCFRCCPPIRSAEYDHIDHRDSLHQELLVNTAQVRERTTALLETSGFKCWGLGYLDSKQRLVGCLLHPAGNNGLDLRDLTGYGDKCRRELCFEARVLAELPPDQARFVLELSDGLDSFEYSSPKINPVFRLLLWGTKVIGALAKAEPHGLTREQYLRKWKIFAQDLDPARHGLPMDKILDRKPPDQAASPVFQERYLAAMENFVRSHRRIMTPPHDNRPFVHQLGKTANFARFMRSALDRPRAAPAEASVLENALDELIYSIV